MLVVKLGIYDEIVDLMGFVNTIITHITNGNQNERKLVNIMGGTVIETESEKLIRKGRNEGRNEGIRMGRLNEIFASVYESDYSVERGAAKAGMEMTEFLKAMAEAGYSRPSVQ